MTATPMNVQSRPFSVEPRTRVMLPDGIFDSALGPQAITCHYTNTSNAALTDVTLHLEGISDVGIVTTPRTFTFAKVPAGSSVLVSWLADFTNATPGKKNVSFIARSGGHTLNRSIKQIFVSRTTYDPATRELRTEVPEGKLVTTIHEAMGPRPACRGDDDRSQGPWLPTRVSLVVHPDPPYEGTFGDLPFQDPWWKVVGWVVFAVAGIAAIIAAAAGGGTAGIGVSGTFEETNPSVDCCGANRGPASGWDTAAGVLSGIATVGLAVGLADVSDAWRRGQEATPPPAGEQTLVEGLDLTLRYPDEPAAGKPFPVEVEWVYARTTTGGTQQFSVTETQTNTHLLDTLEVDVPAQVRSFVDPLVICARFLRDAETPYRGPELYAYALVAAPSGRAFFVPLLDDGIEPDRKANDGTYTGELDLTRAYRLLLKDGVEELIGVWKIYVFAQDVNLVASGLKPEEAAQTIGGYVVASAAEVVFDPDIPCPLKANATVEVV